MNDETIQDLKQFIATTVSQQTAELREELHGVESKLGSQIESLDEKMDTVIEAAGEQLADHEGRITKLETA